MALPTSTYKSPIITIATWFPFIVAILSALARSFVKINHGKWSVKTFAWDDILLVIALVFQENIPFLDTELTSTRSFRLHNR